MKKNIFSIVVFLGIGFGFLLFYINSYLPKKELANSMGLKVDFFSLPKKLGFESNNFLGDGYTIWKFNRDLPDAELNSEKCESGFYPYVHKFNDLIAGVVDRELGQSDICYRQKNDEKKGIRYSVFYKDDIVLFVIMYD